MRRIWRQALEAVTPYEAGKSLEALSQELGLPAIVRLSSNENPLGPSPLVIEALRQEAARAHLYPDGGSTRLREALGSWLGVPPDWLMAGNGGDELLGLIARAAFEPGDEILMPKPAVPLVILDEAYRDFSDDPETPDGVALARRWPRLIALRTFSKIAALAGLRVGYVVGAPEIMGWLNRVRAPFNVNRFAQVAAVAALEDRAHLERTRALVLSERPRLLAELARRGCPAPPSQANFLLPRIGAQARELAAALLKAGILVRDGGAVGFPGHLRIAIGRPEDNARLLEVLDETLAAP